MNLLLINFAPNKLVEALTKLRHRVVTLNKGPGALKLHTYFDVIYYAKFAPPLLDDLPPYNIKSKMPIIYGLHAPLFIPYAWRASNKIYNVVSAFKIPLFKFMELYDAFHALNTNDDLVLRRLGFISYYIPLGVDTELFKPTSKSDLFTIIFVGARYSKGVDMLIKIVPYVLRRANDIRFIFTGKGFLNSIFYYIQDLWPKNVRVVGYLPQKDFAMLCSRAHLLLFPSRWESFGLVVIEALSCGMPVVAFDIPGAPRDIMRNGITGSLVKPFDVDAMAQEVLRYYKIWKQDPEEFKTISDNCRRYALNFDWNIIATHFDKMFQTVIKGKRK